MNIESEEGQPLGSLHFQLSAVAAGHAYPPPEVSAEIGRIAIAATRVDRELALNLQAIRHPDAFDVLLTWSTRRLIDALRSRLNDLFEGPLMEAALRTVEAAATALNERGRVMHSVWDLRGAAGMISVSDLAEARSEEAMDRLLRRDVESPDWATHQPREQGPSAKSVHELEPIRARLETSQEGLQRLRFTLASALFAGKPAGARMLLDPRT
jgi:hypothetical protein